MCFSCLPLCLSLLFFWASAFGQRPEEMREHRSAVLGEVFLAVPFTPVMFAKHETTVAQWRLFLAEAKYAWDHAPHFEQAGDHPVVMVTLQDAQSFCAWLTEKERAEGKISATQLYRLPTPAEWDTAVGLLRTRKATLNVDEQVQDERAYPWGPQWPPPAGVGNFAEGEIPGYADGHRYTAPVGSYAASADGLHDLAGNVWEWTWQGDLRAEQEGVLRGGSWAYFRAECLRSAYLYKVPGDLRMPTVGFRCVFEDRQRTAVLVVAAEQEKLRLQEQQRVAVMGGTVDQAEVAEMRRKLAGGEAAGSLPNPAELAPVKAGAPFKNSLGMEFAPMGTELWAGVTEVRVQDYDTWLKSVSREWPEKPSFLTSASHPAAGLSWRDAVDFCTWLTARDRALKLIPDQAAYALPTDAEWSRMAGLAEEDGADPAARDGKDRTHYPWSDRGEFPPPMMSTNLDSAKINNYSDNYAYTAPVSAEAANRLGIQGLGGNVAEWCADPWPGAENERVVRGGSWLASDPARLLTSVRRHWAADKAGADIGFRVVLRLSTP
jgi:formylglycine-generating enzyme required for sulfatase activity